MRTCSSSGRPFATRALLATLSLPLVAFAAQDEERSKDPVRSPERPARETQELGRAGKARTGQAPQAGGIEAAHQRLRDEVLQRLRQEAGSMAFDESEFLFVSYGPGRLIAGAPAYELPGGAAAGTGELQTDPMEEDPLGRRPGDLGEGDGVVQRGRPEAERPEDIELEARLNAGEVVGVVQVVGSSPGAGRAARGAEGRGDAADPAGAAGTRMRGPVPAGFYKVVKEGPTVRLTRGEEVVATVVVGTVDVATGAAPLEEEPGLEGVRARPAGAEQRQAQWRATFLSLLRELATRE